MTVEAPAFDIQVRGADLLRAHPVEHFTSLRTVERLHGLGTWALELSTTDPAAMFLRQPGAGIEVRRDGNVIFSGVVDEEEETFSQGRRASIFSGFDDNVWLNDAEAWPDPDEDDPTLWPSHDEYATGTELSTRLMTFVREQIGDLALPERQVAQLVMGTDPEAGGTTKAIKVRFGSLLANIADICVGTSLVCWLRQEADDLVFTVRESVDREEVIFTPDRGLSWKRVRRAPRATTVIVAGQGEQELRNIRIVSQTPPSAWPRRIERLYDQRSEDDATKLVEHGERYLTENAAVESLKLDASTSGFRFREHFELGDTVTVGFDEGFFQDVVVEVESTYAKNKTTLNVSIGSEQASAVRAIWARSKGLERRLRALEAQ